MNKYGQLKNEILIALAEAKRDKNYYMIDQLKYRLKRLKKSSKQVVDN